MLFSALVLVASVFVVLALSRRAEASIVEYQSQMSLTDIVRASKDEALESLEDRVSRLHGEYETSARFKEMMVTEEVLFLIFNCRMELTNEGTLKGQPRAQVSRSSGRTAMHRASEASRQGRDRRIQVPDDNRI